MTPYIVFAAAQAVHVMNNPALHVRVVNSPDATAVQSLDVARSTLNWTRAGVIFATIAALAAIWALRATLRQLSLMQRKPSVTMGLSRGDGRSLKDSLTVEPDENENHGERVYHFEVALQNDGPIQADNYRLSILVRIGDYLRLDHRKFYSYFDVMRGGQGDFAMAYLGEDPTNCWDEAYYEARTLPVTPQPLVVCQATIIHNSSQDMTATVRLRFSADGGYYTEQEQRITFQSSKLQEPRKLTS